MIRNNEGKRWEDNDPLISIIVPTFNESKLLPSLLASIRRQSYAHYEIILADDQSTDDTISIGRKFGAIILLNNRIGEFPSRNKGAAIAKGTVLLFTGADVLFPPGVLEKVAESFKRDRKLAGLYAPTYPYAGSVWLKLEFVLWYAFTTIMRLITGEANVSTSFFAVRKDVFLSSGGFPNTAFADSILSRTLSKKFKIRPMLSKVIPVSARRAKMGMLRFNRYHLLILAEILFPPIRSSRFSAWERQRIHKLHTRSYLRNDPTKS